MTSVPLILDFIRGLAVYEKLAHAVVATEEALRATLFGSPPAAQVVIAEVSGQPAGFRLYSLDYSTFLARPGLHAVDLLVKSEYRGAPRMPEWQICQLTGPALAHTPESALAGFHAKGSSELLMA